MTTDATTYPSRSAGSKPRAWLSALRLLVRNKGFAYLITWGHRLTGLLLVGYALFHVYTLSSLTDPAAYDAKMAVFGGPVFLFLEWALAIPVILHSFNGGRLILYELFGRRDDQAMLTAVFVFSGLYVLLLGAVMILGSQSVSPVFFWLFILVAGLSVTFLVGKRIWTVNHAWSWKLQRFTGAFLLVMIPAHMILSHVNAEASHQAAQVVARMQNGFVKAVDVLILLCVMYHAAYGLISIAGDYLASRVARAGALVLIILIGLSAAYFGLRLTLAV